MITESDATDIARTRALEKGWGFAEPVEVVARRRWISDQVFRYEIETNVAELGTRARFVIDAVTGAIMDEGYILR